MKSKAKNEDNILFVDFPKAANPHLQEKIKIRKKKNQPNKKPGQQQSIKHTKIKKKEKKKKSFNSNSEVKCSFVFHCMSCSNNNFLRIKSEIQGFLAHRKIFVLIEHLYEIRILKYWVNYPPPPKKKKEKSLRKTSEKLHMNNNCRKNCKPDSSNCS